MVKNKKKEPKTLYELAAQEGRHGSIAHKGLTLEQALEQVKDSPELTEAFRRFYNNEPIYPDEDNHH